MKLGKALILTVIALTVFAASGFYFINNTPINYFSSQSASSVVYIENAVSGTVTLTDPSLKKTIDLTVYYPLDRGSGVIVTPNGYIITAFHVVSDPQSRDTWGVLKKMDDNDIKNYVEQAAVKAYLSNYNPQLGTYLLSNTTMANQGNLNENIDIITGLLVQNNLINVKSYKQTIKVRFPAYDEADPLNAQLVDVGASNSNDDVALLKVDPAYKNLPSLNVSMQNPQIGGTVRIYGYPARDNETQHQLTPSTAQGQLISETSNSRGTIYYQTNASTAPGYSGGPVLNEKNRVIGILIYGVNSEGNFRGQSQSSLFLSSKYIIQICDKNNVPINVI